MKNEGKKVYSTPEIEVIEIAVEQGFAQSGTPSPDFLEGENW